MRFNEHFTNKAMILNLMRISTQHWWIKSITTSATNRIFGILLGEVDLTNRVMGIITMGKGWGNPRCWVSGRWTNQHSSEEKLNAGCPIRTLTFQATDYPVWDLPCNGTFKQQAFYLFNSWLRPRTEHGTPISEEWQNPFHYSTPPQV